jgi:ribonucleotide monophosphatase NagD (HAD superfamily)
LPHLSASLALGSFKRCFENIFFRQYSDPSFKSSYNYQITGKPSSLAFSYAKSKLQNIASEKVDVDFYMVGDTVESDILGGNSNGFKTILVESGNYKKGDPLIENGDY